MRLIFLFFTVTLVICQWIPPRQLGRHRRQQYKRATLWPDGVVYYTFNDDWKTQEESFKAYTRDAMDLISEVTCITFVEDESQDHKILIIRTEGCSSDIGMTDGNWQTLHLNQGCEEMEAVHEFLHALGFIHIQQRGDRDKYIDIDYSNILEKHRHNFDIYNDGDWVEIVPYDFGSIMHYDSYAFAADTSKPTMIPHNEDYTQTMGSRKLSFFDIMMINEVYSCNDNCNDKEVPTCEHEGYPNPANCDVCICPNGYQGVSCHNRTDDGCGATYKAGPNWAMGVLISNVRDPQNYDRPHYCNYWIKSPPNTKVEIKIHMLTQFECRAGCDYNFLEIKTDADIRDSYPRFCCSDKLDSDWVIDAPNPTVLVMANMKDHHVTAHIEYRYVEDSTSNTEEPETTDEATEAPATEGESTDEAKEDSS